MAKHRKTRQEKMVADSRHVTYHLETTSAQVSKPSEKNSSSSPYKIEQQTPARNTVTTTYSYVSADLRKTAIVTAAIIVAQILIFVALNRL